MFYSILFNFKKIQKLSFANEFLEDEKESDISPNNTINSMKETVEENNKKEFDSVLYNETQTTSKKRLGKILIHEIKI